MGGDGRGSGPAGNIGRGWSWLRSDREYWAWMIVVEVRQGTGGGGKERRRGKETRRGNEERRRGEERKGEERRSRQLI